MLKKFITKWIFLFIITLFNLIISLKTSIVFFAFLFWFLISIIAINLIWLVLLYVGVGFSLVRKTMHKIEEDYVLGIVTVVKNKSFLPVFNFVLEDYFTGTNPEEQRRWILLDYLGAKSSKNIEYQYQCVQRGKYKIGPLAVYLFDPFSLFFLKKTYAVYSDLYVYPRTFNIKNFPALRRGVLPWFGIETTHVSGDEDEIYGVREYKEGDPIRIIHWISTARKNELIVKQFQRQTYMRATILFNLEKDKDFGKGKERVSEYIIKIAASIAKYLIERNVSVEIIARAQEIAHLPFNKGLGHLEDIMGFLTVAKAESKISLGEMMEEFSCYIPNDSTLIVIMLDRDWEYLSQLLSMGKRNVSLVPLILISSTFLYSFDKQPVVRDVQIKLSRKFNFTPILFSRGDNLEEAFMKLR